MPLRQPLRPVLLGEIMHAGSALRIEGTTFTNGRLALLLTNDSGPYGRLAVNVPPLPIEPDEFFAKTYEENEALREPLLASGLFEDTGRRAQADFVELELWRLVPQAFERVRHLLEPPQ